MVNENIQKAAELLKAGELVAFPTETVYGLGADATDAAAVKKIYQAKGRPANNPLIVHFASLDEASKHVEINEAAARLAEAFWPGPLTMVLPSLPASNLSGELSAGLSSVAVRVPGHIIALELLEKAALPIAAPSANRSGKVSPTSAADVKAELGDAVSLIIDGGRCSLGIESTVIDMTAAKPVVLRPGVITAEEISKVLAAPVTYIQKNTWQLKSPGMLARHYSPQLPMRLDANEVLPGEALLAFGEIVPLGDFVVENLSPAGDLLEAAGNLYYCLRKLDAIEYSGIAVMPIPEEGIGVAICDRLRRAAQR